MEPSVTGMARLRREPGLLSEIARQLGITRAAVAKWGRIPAERVLDIEFISGISRHCLRPDIYPAPLTHKCGEQRLANLPRPAKPNSVSADP